ncbi:unnamed protein product [Closterium sp. NIES-65]|nr:unnamed protein product [Closterium sp. NIES-65]
MANQLLALQLTLLVIITNYASSAAAVAAPAPPPPAISSFFPFSISVGSIEGGKLFFGGTETLKPGAPKVAATCSASSLSGYTSSKTLKAGYVCVVFETSQKGLVLHWKATTGTTVDMALQATSAGASGGWFAVGWSPGGKMYPADSVIAHKAGADIGAYTITGYDSSNVVATTAFSLGSPAYSAGLATFSRTVGTGSKVTFVNGPMKTIWGYSDGATTSFDGHGGNRGSTTIDFSCNGTPVATPSPPPASANPSPPPPPAASASPPPPASSASPPPPTATPSPPPAPPAAGVACPASALEGFDYQVELGGPLMLLHWTFSTSTTIKFSIEAQGATIAKDGWIAVGWSGRKGKMKGSDAVIGNLPGVAAVHMSGYSKKLIKQTSAFTIGDTAVATTSEGGTTITFTREVGKGAVPIKLNATNYLIYAFSTTASTTLAFHGWNQGGLAVDFSCFKKPSALWGGGPDYSDDSDYDSSFRSARAASMDGTSTSTAGTSSADSAMGRALSSGRRNRLHQQTGLGHQHHESAVGTAAGDGAVGTGVGMTNADWFILHWKVTTGTTVNMALEAQTPAVSGGWFAVGWSATGAMYPANAVIVNTEDYGDIGPYKMEHDSPTAFIPFANFLLGSATYTRPASTYPGGATTLAGSGVATFRTTGTGRKRRSTSPLFPYFPFLLPTSLFHPLSSFSRTVGTGDKINFVNGPMKTIWAYSDGQSGSFNAGHAAQRGVVTIDYKCDPNAANPPPPAPSVKLPPPTPSTAKPPPSHASTKPSPPPPVARASPPPPPSSKPKPSPPPPVSPPAGGMACAKSSLAGFSYQVALNGPLVLLHWTFATKRVIRFAIEACKGALAKGGWIAVGWSRNKGKMKGSDAVVGNLLVVVAVHLGGYRKNLVKKTKAFNIGSPRVAATAKGSTAITFAKKVGTGNVPIKLNATNYLIRALSSSTTKTFAFHGNNH